MKMNEVKTWVHNFKQITVFCGYSKLRVGTFVQVNGGKAYSYSNNYLYFIIY